MMNYLLRIDGIIRIISLLFLLLYFHADCSAKNNSSSNNQQIKSKKRLYVIDHNFVNISSLSEDDIQRARKTRVYFEHASVGVNIQHGLVSLERKDFRYERNNMIFYYGGNPGAKLKIDGFYDRLTNSKANNYKDPKNFDLVMMKLCYIDNKALGFKSITHLFEYYRDIMNSLESLFPETNFIWWTMPIKTGGSTNRDEFNNLIRNYCSTNGKILFDIADIECHDGYGNYLTDNYGEVLNKSYTEDGGHLNDVGGETVAKAFWLMLAKSEKE